VGISDILSGGQPGGQGGLSFFSPTYSKISPDYAATVQQKPAPLPENASTFTKVSAAGANFVGLDHLFAAAGKIPGLEGLFTFLDTPRRAVDTALISAQHADAAKKGDQWDWGEFFNTQTWSRAWDMSQMGNVSSPTSGQLLANRLYNEQGTVNLDPFNAADALKLQQDANNTWYGSLTSAVSDLGVSMISVPGMGVIARGKAAAGIRSAEDANRVSNRITEAGVVGRTTAQRVGDKVRQYALPNASANVDALVKRQVEGMRVFEGAKDRFQIFNQLKARLPTASDHSLSQLSNIFHEINKVPDEAARQEMRTQFFLAANGSTVAKGRLAELNPLLAKNFENMTTAPRETAAVSELFSKRFETDPNASISQVVDEVWGRPGDKQELANLKDLVHQKRTSLQDYGQLVRDVKALKPKVLGTPEARHIKAKRELAYGQVRDLTEELKKAKADLHGTRRWAAGQAKATTRGAAGTDLASGAGRADFQAGPLAQHADLNQALGEARRRVEDLQKQLDQAKSDRTLLDQTPLHDPQALADWQAKVDQKRLERSGAKEALDLAKQERDGFKAQMEAKKAEIRAAQATLDSADRVINDILDVQRPEFALSGDGKPSALEALKAHMRDRLGADHLVFAGDGNRAVQVSSLPTRAMRWAMEPRARGRIALNEVGLGARQLADVMQRSKVFDATEIRAARSQLLALPEGNLNGSLESARASHVARIQDEMLTRMAQRAIDKHGLDLTPEEVIAHAKELKNLTVKHFGDGNSYILRHANEDPSGRYVTVPTPDGPVQMFDGAHLRSHLADSAPLLDPSVFEKMLSEYDGLIKRNLRGGLSVAANANEMFIAAWKTGALLRPGLMTRSMIDTGPRALASLSATEALVATMNGMAHFVHNRTLKGLSKVEFAGLAPDRAAEKALFLGMKPVEVGGKKIAFATDATERGVAHAAMTKGQTVHGALFHEVDKRLNTMAVDRTKWSLRKPESPLWHSAYKEYADMLLASPTAKKLAELATRDAKGFDSPAVLDAILHSDEFKAEYRKLARPQGLEPEQWLQQLVHETSSMFPSKRILNAAKNGGLTKKLIDKEFPRSERFSIPSPEFSAMEGGRFAKAVKGSINRLYQLFLDKPDMWLARHPVAVQITNRRIRAEYAALERTHGPGYQLSDAEAAMIKNRAKNEAIGYVRNTFFDTTRYTGAHAALGRVSPFIAAWEDAMISWGRLIYDDPRRLTKLAAAYNAPFTLAHSLNHTDLVLDENGQPLTRGKDSQATLVAIPLGAVGAKLGVPTYRMRLDSINSIWQGETWWLPGVGPTVAAPVAWALGSGKVIPKDVALDIVDTKNPMGKAILKSVFLGGEVPPSDPASLAQTALPGWARIIATDALGDGKLRAQLYNYNARFAKAQKNGEVWSPERQAQEWDKAGTTALNAGVVRLAMSAGIGFTGTAAVDGQFYVDQMRIIDAMPPEMRTVDGVVLDPQAFFAHEYPDVADLKMGFTKNDTGINATADAAKAETRLSGILKANNPDLGWMIVGADNVAGDFSRTAYNMQKSSGNRYAAPEKETKADAMAATGFQQYNAAAQLVADKLVAQGFDPETVKTTKEYKAARAFIKAQVAAQNPYFDAKVNEFSNKFNYYYDQAVRLSSSGPLKGRADMQAFQTYDQVRQQVMATYGIASFSGTSPKYGEAKAVMQYAGEQLAAQNIGFSQMWDRFLQGEVD
jgi:hypothetical protein